VVGFKQVWNSYDKNRVLSASYHGVRSRFTAYGQSEYIVAEIKLQYVPEIIRVAAHAKATRNRLGIPALRRRTWR
jgi:hypothetical protein